MMNDSSKVNSAPQALQPGLYIVAMPIGNRRDITLRALDVLTGVSAVACEDTRRTGILLADYGLKKTLLRYDDASGAAARPALLKRLHAGESLALVSDAGTPLIADPGYKLVTEARSAGIAVFPVPGACAAIAALSVAGLPSDAFYFAGFLPRRSAARQSALRTLEPLTATLLFYEAGNRLEEFLADTVVVFGARPVVIAREITKTFESFYTGTLGELTPECTLGECVVLIGGASTSENNAWEPALKSLLAAGISAKTAAAALADAFSVSKRDVYQHALKHLPTRP
ncbi:MAG: 16S rRNA (cytidine(1402)-2'-O)-methyltransferase [Alphaproteobacteria bacterium]|jgi:16S rRNA (cytidine1402-2'-O)-methyltransferase|nr:16S rRNA (cytidine(1402)-2'-O)-methyltransferase [Alphaproteobacteria bacterium]